MAVDIYERLLDRLRGMKAAAVGFSGGTDSTLLLAAAKEVLGDRVLALTAVTPYMERQEAADTLILSAQLGVRHELVELDMPDGLEANPPERCYLCKYALYKRLLGAAREAGFEKVLDGSNLDDLGDFRPGLRALRELDIDSPLLECKITKSDIRRLSELLGLPNWNKPTNACLLTRLPVGQRFTMEDLHRVEEAERFLRTLGYSWLRVRMHGDLARIEVAPEQRLQLLEQADTVVKTLRILGFRHVTMDLFGYRLGSMNPAGSGGARSVSGEAAASDESPSTDSATQGAEHRLHPGVRVEPS
ncbi:MAG: ATP-dependent sacrificial sulfur transferase LarE [Chromatiaceae bacterium]|nr:ATP-dependent sacrificial sulfur transferase LarE [Chromatiaceae bacterium]